jgi:two-component system chemotaxis response regulator CheY
MRRCLVVDDSRVVRKIACRILEEFEFTVDEAEDSESALHACRGVMPEVLLLDGDLAHLNGADFVRALRREKGGDKPLVLYCVTEVDVPHITGVLGAGANNYMLKPYDRIAMRAALAELGFA